MDKISREDAVLLGLKRYFTGRACPAGHVGERYVSDKSCCDCRAEANVRLRETDPDRANSYVTKWREANREAFRAAVRKSYRKHRGRRLASQRAAYAENRDAKREQARRYYQQDREAQVERAKRWQQENPDKQRAIEQRRRARKLDALCACCAPEDFAELNAIARLAGMEIDHIEPLALGGAHCRSNLQLLTPEQHKLKTASDMRRIAEFKRQQEDERDVR